MCSSDLDMMRMLKQSNKVITVDAFEDGFLEQISQALPCLSMEEAVRVQEIACRSAYAKQSVTTEEQEFMNHTYQEASITIYSELPWYRKLYFQYIYAF